MDRSRRLPPDVNRVLFVRQLPFKVTADEMYDIFGKFGAIRQIRLGTEQATRGSAYVVYEDIYDAKQALDKLQGFNVGGRYLTIVYYNQGKVQKKLEAKRKQEEIEKMRKKFAEAEAEGDTPADAPPADAQPMEVDQ